VRAATRERILEATIRSLSVHGYAGLRVLIVWLYNNTGKSVLAAILVHDTDNVSASLFPNDGSHYDPAFTGVITATTAVIVALLWRSRTLARFKLSEAR
jgi:CAAX protease family protein